MRSVAVVRYESSLHSFLDHGREQHVPSNMLTGVKKFSHHNLFTSNNIIVATASREKLS